MYKKKKGELELTSEEHQSSFNQNFSAGFFFIYESDGICNILHLFLDSQGRTNPIIPAVHPLEAGLYSIICIMGLSRRQTGSESRHVKGPVTHPLEEKHIDLVLVFPLLTLFQRLFMVLGFFAVISYLLCTFL